MIRFTLIPWEYGVRNLFRRPMRTLLTLTGLTTVIVLVFIVIGFIRGLEHSLTVSGDPKVALLFSLGMGENLEYSSIPMRTSQLVSASVDGIKSFHNRKYVSPELYLGTQIEIPGQQESAMGLVRGVTQSVLLVRRQVELESGNWPGPGEILVGQLASTKLGLSKDQLAVGTELNLEGRTWRISGTFSAAGSAFESEIWCRLDELQQAMKRQDLSLVAVTLISPSNYPDLDLFCKERLDLELQSIREVNYYQSLKKDYGPIRMLAWLVVFLVSGAGVFAGLNTLYGAVIGRTRELSTLQTIGFLRSAIVISLIQEGLLLATAASLTAALIAVCLINGIAVRFTMGAFSLQIDSISLLIGCGVGMLLGLLGAIPPALRALRLPVVEGLKSV
ncbi:MAG: ABC transporter permease [Planctomycetes bacterium]|nr:ABC transporter permease [Planctomycetota bacterium]MCH9724802.1 ABC transporter permease [Planctomycetota bacterium]MCH9778742.1 ABC transporter permease [Planctomycetota bacterium]MCH9790596.1 ABC transporter permease [Planctomycetota bacterium]